MIFTMPANHNIPHTAEAKAKMSAAHRGIPQFHKRRPSQLKNGIEVFRCGSCGRFLPREGFYKNRRTILGLTSACRKCHCKCSLSARNKAKHRKSNREYSRRARKRDPEKARAYERARPRRTGPKLLARQIVYLAVRIGAITRPPKCSRCGITGKITGHHADYSKPLDVQWLCHLCHAAVERGE